MVRTPKAPYMSMHDIVVSAQRKCPMENQHCFECKYDSFCSKLKECYIAIQRLTDADPQLRTYVFGCNTQKGDTNE